MAQNDYLAKRDMMYRGYFDLGLQCGRQQILDMVSLVLRDPEIMGKDTFGKERLLKVVKGVGDYLDHYSLAWQRHDEADYWRAKLDEALADAYGNDLYDSFTKRYEIAQEYDYKKGKWKK